MIQDRLNRRDNAGRHLDICEKIRMEEINKINIIKAMEREREQLWVELAKVTSNFL